LSETNLPPKPWATANHANNWGGGDVRRRANGGGKFAVEAKSGARGPPLQVFFLTTTTAGTGNGWNELGRWSRNKTRITPIPRNSISSNGRNNVEHGPMAVRVVCAFPGLNNLIVRPDIFIGKTQANPDTLTPSAWGDRTGGGVENGQKRFATTPATPKSGKKSASTGRRAFSSTGGGGRGGGGGGVLLGAVIRGGVAVFIF